ncbi:sensor histidine kinase [Paenibacillus sp. HJGM_3]|uniref:cache domain-containing sensor histidine kinase n=1 Tax=Paenibacillus sp. HJGM_3 TaxID=3379816 RepID=UPI00385B9765
MRPWIVRLFRPLTALSINAKLNAIIVLFLCLPFAVFGLVWFQKSTETIQANARLINQELLRQTISQLDSYFTDLERSTFPLVSNPLIQTFMTLQPDNYLELLNVRSQAETTLLPNLFSGRTDIYGFSIVSRKGAYAIYGNTDRERAVELLNRIELSDRETYKVMGLSFDKGTPLPLVTIIRKFWDTQKYETTGFLMFDLNLNQVTRIVKNIQLGKTGKVSLIDAQGAIVYHTDPSLWGKQVAEDDRRQFADKQEGYFFKGSGSSEILTVFQRSPLNGWIIMSEVPLRELVGDLIWIRNLSVWVLLALVLFVLVALSSFSYYLSRSLLLLQRLMQRAENGDMTVQAPERRQDEIGKLNRSFNKMVGEIRRLIEVVHKSELKEKELQLKQREAVVQAMQSQINPHFLYNTLEVINSYALVEGVIPISNMTTALSDLFRYSVGSPNEIVTLKEEIVHLRSYFEIQKERYRSLSVELDTNDAETARVQAIRLLIQPLVENAFKHGYERKKLRPDYIGIAGSGQPDAYVLTVSDRGGGMTPEQVEAFNRRFADLSTDSIEEQESKNDSSTGDSPVRQGIGLWNVHQRIRLVFGPAYGLHIVRSDASGTQIQIKLPYDKP